LQFTRAAPHAVVDHAVQACVRLRKGSAKGLVNGVLRNFLRGPDALLSQARKTEEGRWSYPQWWIDQVRRDYPYHLGAVLEAGNAHPPMTLRVNLRRIARDDYLALLTAEGLLAEAIGPAALLLAQPVGVDRLPGFGDGLVSVQDLAAQYAQPLLEPAPGQRVLDACAAPGGKTAHLLERTDLDLIAIDSDAQRLERVRETLLRLQLPARLICADAGEPSTWWDGKPFDRILLDAPCTAAGIVRRHPDIKWLRRPEDIPALAAQQRRLLQALWHTLAAGGKLLYATCSIFPAENQLQVAAFLQSHPEAKLLPLSGFPEGPKIGNIPGQILPDPRHDGFFYALLQKA
jgi:16S rRNA (cytosine967-C5)-methyltransferase